jgi:4-aminobutyrate aminotransferase-like enzyme
MSNMDLIKTTDAQSAFEKLISNAIKSSEDLNGVRPLDPSKTEQSKAMFAKYGKLRGRDLFFNYIGTGRGHGPYVELIDGSVKMDLINGIGVNILGHSHPELLKASVCGALSDVVMQGNLQPNLEYGQALEKLVEIGARGSRLKYAWLTTCGAMAGENALKMARQKTKGARKIIAMENAFAGRSTIMAEITDNPAFREDLPTYEEVLRIPFYNKHDSESSKKALALMQKYLSENEGDVGVFCFEPMQGEGGFNVAPREYFIPLFEACKKAGVPIWFDEVQTFCRTGEFFTFQTMNLGEYADIVTVAKSLQGAATLYTEELNPRAGLVSGTFAGSSSALASAKVVMDILDNEGYMGPKGKIQKIHNEFIEMLNSINASGPTKGLLHDAEGLGLMIGVIPFDGSKDKTTQLMKKLFDNGVICFSCGRGPYKLRFLLPAILESKHIHEAKAIIEKSILECL